jgi:Helix-turn-helix domain
MPRPERQLDPSTGPREGFAYELRQLRHAAGSPTYQRMAERAHYSRSALSEAAGGHTFPSWEVTRAFVLACNGDEHYWAERWAAAQQLDKGSTSHEDPPADKQRPEPASRSATNSLPIRRPGRRWPRWATLVIAPSFAGAAIFLGLLLSPQPAAPAHSIFLGNADLARYCRAQGYQSASLDGATAGDWHCSRPPATKDSLSVIEACRQQYGRSTATARYNDLHNPYSWQCWDHVVFLGRVDLDKYCRADGYSSAVLDGPTIDTWRCVSDNGVRTPIDLDSACRWQYGRRVLVANPANLHAPWEKWDCWG